MQPTSGGDNNLIVISQDFLTQKFDFFCSEINSLKEIIKNLKSAPKDPLLAEEDLAILLKVGTRTIKNRLRERVMDYAEIQGKRYVRQSEVDKYIAKYIIPKRKSINN